MCVRVYKRELYGVIAKVHSVNNQLPEFDNAAPKSFSVDVSMTIMITIKCDYLPLEVTSAPSLATFRTRL